VRRDIVCVYTEKNTILGTRSKHKIKRLRKTSHADFLTQKPDSGGQRRSPEGAEAVAILTRRISLFSIASCPGQR